MSDPAAALEALVTGRILNDSVKGDVVAHDDLSHFRLLSLVLSFTTAATVRSSAVLLVVRIGVLSLISLLL